LAALQKLQDLELRVFDALEASVEPIEAVTLLLLGLLNLAELCGVSALGLRDVPQGSTS